MMQKTKPPQSSYPKRTVPAVLFFLYTYCSTRADQMKGKCDLSFLFFDKILHFKCVLFKNNAYSMLRRAF